MSLVIGLWAMTALAVVVGRARRGSWKTVRRYQAGQRALARLGPKEPARHDDPGQVPAVSAEVDEDPLPHVRLIEGDHLPPPRPASYAGERPSGSRRPGWARMADGFDARPSVSIDTRTRSHTPADPKPEPRPAPAVAADAFRAPAAVAADAFRAPARATAHSFDPDPLTMASLIRVARPDARRPRWMQPPNNAPRPAKVLVGAAAAVLALLAIGAAATMRTRPSEASVSERRAATTHPAPPPTAATPHATVSMPPAPAPPAQISGDAQAATVSAPTGSTVQLAATGPCWIQVRTASSGPVIAESTLAAGQTASFPFQDGLWMRLGDPGAVTLSIDGRTLALPSQAGQPIDVSFSRRAA